MSVRDNTDINPEGIDEELREKRQWMLWDSDANTPRRPFGWDADRDTLDFSGSWKEPTDWLTFEEALAAAQTKESYGIGFVFRDAEDWIALDLDGCLDDDGELKEWVPDIDSFEGETYIERSPSGTGLHVLVEHRQLPPWWADQHFTDGEHEGVEAYESKFMTVTGDKHPASAGEIGAVNPDGFLWNAFKNITGETPDLSDTDDPDGPPSGGSDEINVSVHDVISGYTEGERCEHPIHGSGTGSNFHIDDGGETWVCWRGSCPGVGEGNATVGNALHMLGMQESIIDCGDWVGSSLSDSEWEQIFDAARAKDLDVPEKKQKVAVNGGAAAGSDGSASGPIDIPGDDRGDLADGGDGDPWEAVYSAYTQAELDDQNTTYLRKKSRYSAVEQLLDQDDWITNDGNWVLYHYRNGRFVEKADGRVQNILSENLREHYTNHEKREILNHLRGRTTTPERDVGGPPEYICAQNCVIHVDREPTRLDHSPDYNFLSQLGCDYDPDADCPTFRSALDDWISDDRTRMKLQEFAGYCLMHWDYPYHKVLFLVGPTASGKSTFLDTIRAMLGNSTVANLTPQQMTTGRFDAAGLYGRWANIRNDIPETMIENTGTFKEIAAADPIKAEWKFKDQFEFEPKAKHMFSANQLPDANTDDEAFYRRVLLAPFPSTVPPTNRDKQLDDKLQAELPGVLNWALEGLQRLRQQGSFTGDLPPGRTQETWEKWGHAADRFEAVCLEESTGDFIPKKTVYQAFQAYCEDENVPSCSQRQLTTRLKEEAGIMDDRKYIDGRQQRCYINVQLTSRGEEYLPDDDDDDSGGAGDTAGLDSY